MNDEEEEREMKVEEEEEQGQERQTHGTWHISAHAFINHILQLQESAASQANRQLRKPG